LRDSLLFEIKLLWRLKNKEQYGSGSLGIPRHSVWVRGSHRGVVRRERFWCSPEEKFGL
jgi:hypothetical protein